MANQSVKISTLEEIGLYYEYIRKSSDKTVTNIKKLLTSNSSIDILSEFKFSQIGYEPIQGYKLNFIEQLNQMFSHIVVLKGVEYLLKRYPEKGFILNMGTQGGYDIVSCDDKIICECFSTTSPISNNKIKLDAEKLMKNNFAERKYIIFYSKEVNDVTLKNIRNKYDEITFVKLENISL